MPYMPHSTHKLIHTNILILNHIHTQLHFHSNIHTNMYKKSVSVKISQSDLISHIVTEFLRS